VTDLPVLQPTKFEDLVQEGHMPVTIRRRELIAAIGGATVASPLAARAQQPGRTFRLGVLIPSARETPPLVAFFDELRLNGLIEGQNIAVIPGGSDIRYEQVAEQMAAIIKAAPDAQTARASARRIAPRCRTRVRDLLCGWIPSCRLVVGCKRRHAA
jgi:hypothetical protein